MQRIFYLHVSARAFSGRWGSLRQPAGRSTDCSAFAFMYLRYYANYNSLLAIVRSAAAGTCKGGFRVLLTVHEVEHNCFPSRCSRYHTRLRHGDEKHLPIDVHGALEASAASSWPGRKQTDRVQGRGRK